MNNEKHGLQLLKKKIFMVQNNMEYNKVSNK